MNRGPLHFPKKIQMLCFQFHQNRTMKEEFDFFGEGGGGEGLPGGKGAPIHKFLFQLILVNI